MKRLSNLDMLVPHPGADDPDPTQRATNEQKAATGTMRRYLRVMFLNLPPTGLEESDRNHQIATKLRIEGNAVDFEDAEFQALWERVKANGMGWPGYLHHFIVEQFREAESRKLAVTIEEAK